MRIIAATLLSVSLLAACGGDDDDTPPPPPQTVNTPFVNGQPTPQAPVAPPGQVMVTVNANSTPPGAMVTGGNRQLGVTPLTTQVPIPAPQPGQTQTFAFVFSLDGYQPATINTSPMNGVISITAALAPATQAVEVGAEGDPDSEGGNEITVNGRGGGPIFDNHTTTGSAVVDESCVVDRLRVRLEGTHTYFQDLTVTLRDPQGHSYTLQTRSRRNPFRTHVVRRAAGRQARGTWNVSVADTVAQDSGRLNGWRLMMTCR